MPNASNIASPLTIIAYGRSGTSLLSAILEHSDNVDFVGETTELICSIWRGAETSAMIVRRNIDASDELSVNDFCTRAVQRMFLDMFPSEKPLWLQKPIGMPECFWLLNDIGIDSKTWYWNVLKSSFPEGKYLTILRNPIDVAVSAHLYWGFNIADIVAQLAELTKIITHPDSLVRYAVSYDRIMSSPKRTIMDLCKYLGIPFKKSMLVAMYEDHVPRDRERDAKTLTRQSTADILSQITHSPEYANMLHLTGAMWRRFNIEPNDFFEESRYVRSLNKAAADGPVRHWRAAHARKLALIDKAKEPVRWALKRLRRIQRLGQA